MEAKKNTIKHLTALAHLDMDAVHAYDQAIEKIDVQDVRERLSQFKADHLRHIDNLSEEIRKLGGEPPKFSRDFKGFLIQGMTAVRSVTGTEGALHAMKTNEKLTNTTYDRALQWDLPADVMRIVENNRDDERHHLKYIEQAIQNRIWEKKQAA